MAEPTTTQLALEVRDLSRTFGARKALDKVSFDLPRGAFLSIFGPNGAGKTTHAQGALHAHEPVEGHGEGRRASMWSRTRWSCGSKIGFISHNPLLYPDLTAEENLEFFAELYCIDNPKDRPLHIPFGHPPSASQWQRCPCCSD